MYNIYPKYSDTYSKIWIIPFDYRMRCLKSCDGIVNSVDPDQNAPLGLKEQLIWAWSNCLNI